MAKQKRPAVDVTVYEPAEAPAEQAVAEAPAEQAVAEAPAEAPVEETPSEAVEAPVVEAPAPVAEAPAEPAPVEEDVTQEMKAVLRNAVKGSCRPTLLQFDQRSGVPRNALIELDSDDVAKLWGIWCKRCGSRDQEGFVSALLELMGQYPARIMRIASPYKLE